MVSSSEECSGVPASNLRAWSLVIALGLMSAGTTGTYSVIAGSFVAPVCQDLGFDYSAFSFYFTAILLGLSVGLPLFGRHIPRVVGKKSHIAIEFVLLAAGAAMGFYHDLWMFMLSALIIGICFCFTTGVCMSDVIDQWFKKSAGFAIGLAWGVNSLCVLVLSPLITAAIDSFGWRSGFWVLAAVSALLILPASIFVIRFSPTDMGYLPYGYDPDGQVHENVNCDSQTGEPVERSILSFPFLFMVLFLCLVQLTCCMNQLFPTYAVEIGLNPMIGSFMVSAASLADIVLNPLVGFTCDRFGSIRAVVVWVGVSALSFLLLMVGAGSPALSIFAAGVNDTMFAITGTALPMMVLTIFGSNMFGKVYSSICSAGYIVGAFGMPVMMGVYRASGSFRGVFIFCIACDVVIAALAIAAIKSSNHVK